MVGENRLYGCVVLAVGIPVSHLVLSRRHSKVTTGESLDAIELLRI